MLSKSSYPMRVRGMLLLNVHVNFRLRAVPIFALEFVKPLNAGARKPRRGKIREEGEKNRDYRQPIVQN